MQSEGDIVYTFVGEVFLVASVVAFIEIRRYLAKRDNRKRFEQWKRSRSVGAMFFRFIMRGASIALIINLIVTIKKLVENNK